MYNLTQSSGYIYIYIYIYIYTHTHTHYIKKMKWLSKLLLWILDKFTSRQIPSSCCAAITNLPDSLSPPVSIVHRSWEVFKATSCIGTELSYIVSSWLFCLCSSMWRGPQEYIVYEFVLTSPAVSCMSGSSNLDSFHDTIYQPLRSGRIWHKVNF